MTHDMQIALIITLSCSVFAATGIGLLIGTFIGSRRATSNTVTKRQLENAFDGLRCELYAVRDWVEEQVNKLNDTQSAQYRDIGLLRSFSLKNHHRIKPIEERLRISSHDTDPVQEVHNV